MPVHVHFKLLLAHTYIYNLRKFLNHCALIDRYLGKYAQ